MSITSRNICSTAPAMELAPEETQRYPVKSAAQPHQNRSRPAEHPEQPLYRQTGGAATGFS
jgi:hypothetical protein